MKGFVDTLDKKSLMAIVGERLLASVSDTKNGTTVETSETKENVQVSTNLNNAEEEVSIEDKVSAFRKYLKKY